MDGLARDLVARSCVGRRVAGAHAQRRCSCPRESRSTSPSRGRRAGASSCFRRRRSERCALACRRARVCTVSFAIASSRVHDCPALHRPPDPRLLGVHADYFNYVPGGAGRMRIVVDVSPLSHPRTGVGNYIRGSLLGLAGRGHELVAFAPVTRREQAADRGALAGAVGEAALAGRPGRACASDAVEPRRSPPGRADPRRLRRPALQRLDVSPAAAGASARRWCTTSCRRCDIPRGPRAHDACTVRSTGTLRRRATSSWSTRASRGTMSPSCSAFHERILVAYPASIAASCPTASALTLGRPYVLTVATLEPRKNLGTLVEAHRRLGELALAVAGAAGWGRQPSARPCGRRAARLHHPASGCRGYTAAPKYSSIPSLFEGF